MGLLDVVDGRIIGAIKGRRSSRSELLRPALPPRSQSSMPIRASQSGPTRHVTALRAGKVCWRHCEPVGSVSEFDLRREHSFFYRAKCRVEHFFF
jgi:hypothetical protein